MKIVSVTMVKNESDIIESFIRYNLQILDKMYIIDTGSNDDTQEIIAKLIDEGLSLELSFNFSPSYDQSQIITSKVSEILEKTNFDYIIPLDADEFLTNLEQANIRESILSLPKNKITYIEWLTYVPMDDDDLNDSCPITRIKHCRNVQHNYDKKIIIPRLAILDKNFNIKQGSHNIEINGVMNTIEATNPKIILAHFPIRGVDHAMSKFLVGWLGNLARSKPVLFDWAYYYNIIKSKGALSSVDVENMAKYYDVPKNLKIDLTKNPFLKNKDFEIKLRYTNPRINVLNNLLSYSENICLKYAEIKDELKCSEEKFFSKEFLSAESIKDYITIDGWLSQREALELYKLVEKQKAKEITIVELGSWKGKSAYVFAKAMLDFNKTGKVYCIDPFNCDGDESSKVIYSNDQEKNNLFESFKTNLTTRGVFHLIEPIREYSFEVIKNFNKPIDILFIDGNHDTGAVLKDYQDWSPLVKKGGYIAFHDVGSAHTIGPKTVVEYNLVRDKSWQENKLIDEIYTARKVK